MKVLLISPQRLKDTSKIDNNVSDRLLKDITINVQETILQPILGTNLYNKLTGENPSGLTEMYKVLIEKYIWNVLKYAVISELVLDGTYKITSSGVVKSGSSDFEVLSDEELNMMKKSIKYDMNQHTKYLIEFLNLNSSEFPEYTSTNELGDYPSTPLSFGGIYISKEAVSRKNNTAIF